MEDGAPAASTASITTLMCRVTVLPNDKIVLVMLCSDREVQGFNTIQAQKTEFAPRC